MSDSKDELYRQLKAAEKRANQRLLRLEQRGIETFASKIAKNDIENQLGRESGKTRFSSRKSMTYGEMEKELKYANKFLKSTSSTVTGINKSNKKRNATFSKRYGSKNPNDLYKILSSEAFRKVSELISSGQVVVMVNDALNNGKPPTDIIQNLNRLLESENDGYLIDVLNGLLNAEKRFDYDYEDDEFE